MKIALINGSPKAKDSNSEIVLNDLNTRLAGNEMINFSLRAPKLSISEMKSLISCDILIFAFPLYVDGIPSHMLKHLQMIEESIIKPDNTPTATVYAISNCGFYEGHQNNLALEIVKNWTNKVNLNWGMGVGIGCGEMLSVLKDIPDGKGPKKNYSDAISTIVNKILSKASADNIYFSPNFPRFAYKFLGEMGWRQQIKKSGGKTKDLFKRL